VFCAGSVLCALAPDAGVLISGRAVMGLGAAASGPGTLSMLRHLYRDERTRNRAIGVWAAASGLALAVSPVLGGALVGIWSWRAIFWFNLAFGAVTLVAAAIVLPENADPEAHRVDIVGALLGGSALAALIFGVMAGESTGFTAPAVLALFCVSVIAGCAFLWREYRAAHPLLDLQFLRFARFTVLGALVIGAGILTAVTLRSAGPPRRTGRYRSQTGSREVFRPWPLKVVTTVMADGPRSAGPQREEVHDDRGDSQPRPGVDR
jgi:MFS family permease